MDTKIYGPMALHILPRTVTTIVELIGTWLHHWQALPENKVILGSIGRPWFCTWSIDCQIIFALRSSIETHLATNGSNRIQVMDSCQTKCTSRKCFFFFYRIIRLAVLLWLCAPHLSIPHILYSQIDPYRYSSSYMNSCEEYSLAHNQPIILSLIRYYKLYSKRTESPL